MSSCELEVLSLRVIATYSKNKKVITIIKLPRTINRFLNSALKKAHLMSYLPYFRFKEKLC